MRTTHRRDILILAGLLALAPQPAFAYIDPGLGSLIFQGAIAGFVTVAAAWAGFKTKIRSMFSSVRKADGEKENASQ